MKGQKGSRIRFLPKDHGISHAEVYMSYSLNSLKGCDVGVAKGNTAISDHGSHVPRVT